MAASVIKSGVIGVAGGEQTEALADAGVELALSPYMETVAPGHRPVRLMDGLKIRAPRGAVGQGTECTGQY